MLFGYISTIQKKQHKGYAMCQRGMRLWHSAQIHTNIGWNPVKKATKNSFINCWLWI